MEFKIKNVFMNRIKKYRWTISGVLIGAIGGFLYWNFIGCSSGKCLITSIWYNSTVYGGLMGGLILNLVTNNMSHKQV